MIKEKNVKLADKRKGEKEKGENFLKKFWNFLWYEDSVLSWVTLIILAFILIKFVFYPGLGLIMGTDFPVVAVVSESMEHHPSDFDQWWSLNEDFYLRYNITKADFVDFPFKNGFNKGDIMILVGVDPKTIKKGSVMVYWSKKPYPIIHRFIGNNSNGDSNNNSNNTHYLMTKGDNNPWFIQDYSLNEKMIPEEAVLGKAVIRIPWLGYVKIWATNLVSFIVH